ncbi:ABC transporter ATP-binding protein [Sulfobacillus harzensis]|uniref:ABC transporter ATP-binding protein n=1 Tax=Sulfobacillus harzensis TaxID=2729629 RepID=A0A7Y0Q4S7_9FIRM|nr:ABC transporter ATP-binding protein [Sulfobacillus harzensis]NMP24725.1 ABC transporter ATP-binding protein [Sulfobacillus harzensis]
MSQHGSTQNRPGGFGPRGGGPMGLAMPVQKAKNPRATLIRLIGQFRPFWARLILVTTAAMLSTVFSIWSPKILGRATTVLFQGFVAKLRHVPGARFNLTAIRHDLTLLGLLYVVSAVFMYLQQYVMAGVAQRMVFGLREALMEKLNRLPVRFFDNRPHGEILSRFVNDFDNISSTLQQSLTQLITAVVTFIGVVIMMLTISPLMTLAVAITLPLSFVVTSVVAKRSQQYFLTRQRQLGEINGHIEEMYTGHAIVKAYGHEERAIETFEEINQRLYQSSWKAQFVTGIIMPLMNVIGNIGYVLVSVIGGLLVTRRTIQVGDIQAFIQYARQFSQPITQLASISNTIQSTLASAERVFEILDEPEESPDNVTEIEKPGRGHVQFDDVSFSYRAGTPLIQHFSVDVAPGATVAIVGPTGAGKTTLVNLLMRFYDPGQGAIRIDGVDIRHMARPEVRGLFGMVLQDTWLFYGTIRDNIAYGREGASFEDVVRAAQAAHADHFIRTLPDGYDTLLNEEATNISLGQRQLLTIARAFLADPPILILDEATSSVDTRTEVAIQSAMKNLMHGRTSFVIAHRLSTIRDADVILVMNHGQILEQGTHQQLLDHGGFYRELYLSQFQSSRAVDHA